MLFVLDFLREAGDVLLAAEFAVVAVSAALGALAMFFVMCFVLEVVACWRIFRKAGQGGWKSLIPVYSNFVRYKISWRPLWFWVGALLLAASIGLSYCSGQSLILDAAALIVWAASCLIHLAGCWNLSRAFGQGALFALGLALFSPLFTLILGLGGAEYRGPQGRGVGP